MFTKNKILTYKTTSWHIIKAITLSYLFEVVQVTLTIEANSSTSLSLGYGHPNTLYSSPLALIVIESRWLRKFFVATIKAIGLLHSL